MAVKASDIKRPRPELASNPQRDKGLQFHMIVCFGSK